MVNFEVWARHFLISKLVSSPLKQATIIIPPQGGVVRLT